MTAMLPDEYRYGDVVRWRGYAAEGFDQTRLMLIYDDGEISTEPEFNGWQAVCLVADSSPDCHWHAGMIATIVIEEVEPA